MLCLLAADSVWGDDASNLNVSLSVSNTHDRVEFSFMLLETSRALTFLTRETLLFPRNFVAAWRFPGSAISFPSMIGLSFPFPSQVSGNH